MARSWRLLQVVLIAASLVVVFVPVVRTEPVRCALHAAYFVFGARVVYKVVRSGIGRMTPAELHASGVRADHVEFLTTMLGIVALALLSFR